jgi:hypothetical protein
VLSLTQGTRGSDGLFYHMATMAGPSGESESVLVNADFTLRERRVSVEKRYDFRELYIGGTLRKRLHFSTRQTAGGTETYVQREESFP